MTRIDFYVAQPNSRFDRYLLACRIAIKAHQAKHRVFIHTVEPDEIRHLDRLLWTLDDMSFIPHGVIGQADPAMNPILIGDVGTTVPDQAFDVLINLAPEVPDFFSRFERLVECVDQDAQITARSRERYRFYRDRGYALKMHNMA